MIDAIIILTLSILIIIGIERIKVKSIRDILFLLVLVPSWYLSMSISLLIIYASNSITFPTEGWYIKLFLEWLSLVRSNIFPEDSYPSFILGILIGFHVASIEIYLPRSTLFRREEAREFINRIMCVLVGFFDGIFVGGVVGLIGIPIAIIVHSLITYANMLIQKVSISEKLKYIHEVVKNVAKFIIMGLLLSTMGALLSIFVGAICGLNSPSKLAMFISSLSPYVKATVIGVFYGWLGGLGSTALGTLFSILGWYGYVRNIMPYWVVIGTQKVGKDIVGYVGATIGAIFGMFLGAILEFMIRQWKYLKEKMRELALKEKRAKFKTIEPGVLNKVIEMGAFDIREAKEAGISPDIVAALYGSGILDNIGGKLYVLNIERAKKYILGFGEVSRSLKKILDIPRIELSEKINDFLGYIGIKNMYLIIFDPRMGPTPQCSLRHTKFAYLLFNDPSIAVTLSSISRTVTEAKIHDAKLILRTYTTKFHGRDLFHIVCAEVSENVQRRIVYDIMADIADEMGIRECLDKECFRKVIDHVVGSRRRR